MVKIKSLRLENCQSWEDATIELGPGLNAIIANNNVGKSVIFKVIKVTCNPEFFSKPEREKLIRYGKEYAKATYTFSDNSVATVTITDRKIMYSFVDSDGNQSYSENQPLTQILQNLSIIVEENSKYLVNVLDSEQSLLLVKSDKKANADLLKVITDHKDIDRLTFLFKDKLNDYGTILSDTEFKEEKIKHHLDSLEIKDVDTLKDQVAHLDALYDELDFLENLELETTRMMDSVTDLLGIDWGLFEKLFNNMEHIEIGDYIGWEDFIELIKVLPENKIEHNYDEVDWKIIENLLNHCQKINVNEIPNLVELELFVKIKEECYRLGELLEQSKSATQKIEELTSIDFNGAVYDCPVHGKIVYNNGRCEVADVR